MKREEAGAQRFLVLGAARSGIAAARLLQMHGIPVAVADSKSAADAASASAELASSGITAIWGDTSILEVLTGYSVLVKSPGIPQDNPIVVAARNEGIRIISEIELASAFLPGGTRVAAITGTNGKTTTTAWLAHTLAGCGFDAITAGNIGDAWSARLLTPPADPSKTIYVVEVSSFQLENIEDFHPDVAILTNITPDHMDRYEDRMDLYVAAKANILKNMAAPDVFIWNAADEASGPVVERSRAENRAFTSSITSQAGLEDADICAAEGRIWLRGKTDTGTVAADAGATTAPGTDLMQVSDLPLPGLHNLENALAVLLAADALGADMQRAVEALKTFPGVEHRIELCGRRADGVAFYNDSKATNLDAMEKAVVAFAQPIVLIAGGRDAHSDYGSISPLIQKHVSHLVTIGEAAPLIEAAWGNLVPTRRAESMQQAVALANELAEAESVVVFSPACKSFDMYNNYEERGRDFKAQVQALLGSS